MKSIRHSTCARTVIRLAFGAIAGLAYGCGAGQDASRQTQLLSGPYSMAVGTNTATVCWQTKAPLSGMVRYRAADSPDWSSIDIKEARFHAVNLGGLKPETQYEAAVLAGQAELGSLSFVTAPDAATECMFWVYGDTRSFPKDHEKVARAIGASVADSGKPTFVVHLGDLAQFGSDEAATATQFFGPARFFLRKLSLVPVRGNHEGGTDLFKKYFPVPKRSEAGGDADDFCQDYGPVRLVALDQYSEDVPGEARLKWIADRLAEATNRWRVVCFHEPMYSSGRHGGNEPFREAVEPVLVKGKAHVVFAAHDHDYERAKPIRGIVHFVSGGGGAPMRPAVLKGPWSAKFEMIHHFLTVSVTAEKMTIRAHGEESDKSKFEEFDRVDIPWECDWK